MTTTDFPANVDLIPFVLEALRNLGGQGTNDQIRIEVIKSMNLSSEIVNKIHSGARTELEYKLAWARTLAKQKGLLTNVGRMTWKIIPLRSAAEKAAAELKAKQEAEARAAAELIAKQEAETKAAADLNSKQEAEAKAAAAAKAAALKKTTITCIKGKLTKNVTAVKPVCPAGYKKK